jgi:uncharacterized damage-inducible protein DinB
MSASELIDRYALGGRIWAYATQGLTSEQSLARPGPGAWSIAELAVHVADAELVYSDRIKRLIAEPNPTLQAFDENQWAANLHYQDQPLEEMVAIAVGVRQWTARILRATPETAFANRGRHTGLGEVTLAEMLSYITNHLDHHLRFLYMKRANLGTSLDPRYSGVPA